MFSWQLKLDFTNVFGQFSLVKQKFSYQFEKWIRKTSFTLSNNFGYNTCFHSLHSFLKYLIVKPLGMQIILDQIQSFGIKMYVVKILKNLELLIHSLKFSTFVLINTFLIQIEPLYFIVTMFSIFDYFVKCYFGLGWNLAKLHDFVDRILVSILSKLN